MVSNSIGTSIAVWINGEQREIPGGSSVTSLLEWLEISGDRVAVELNKSIVRKRDWREAEVAAGSHIEIVEFVGGG